MSTFRLRDLVKNFDQWGIIKFAKRTSLPGFEKVSIYAVSKFFWREMLKERITMRASALAFSFFLALFPAIIFLITLIPYIPIENLQENLLIFIKNIMPEGAFVIIAETVEDIINKPNGGLLSFGFIVAIYFAMNGVGTLMNAFDKTHATFRRRGFFHQELVALQITLLLSVLVVCSVILILAGEGLLILIVNALDVNEKIAFFSLNVLKWLTIISLFFISISLLYFLGPATKKKWQFFSPGSILSTALILITSLGFSYYVNHFDRYNEIYGSIGTIMVIMLWLYFNSLVLLIGFELNASIKESKYLLESKNDKD